MGQLHDKFLGVLLGGAIGDALGAPTEKHEPDEIIERYGRLVLGFVPPWDGGRSGRQKGDGHVTDDTLMTAALCRAYLAKQAPLDAYDARDYLLPEMKRKDTWVPELQREMPLLERVFYPEKYLHLRLDLANVEPREAGMGNMVNCGAAMYAAPIGLLNAADPDAAYREAIDLFAAHQYSYGREAGGVQAACVAAALTPNASVASVIDSALRLARDGTKKAIVTALAVVAQASVLPVNGAAAGVQPRDLLALFAELKIALAPFILGGRTAERRAAGLPGPHGSIEELPVALALLQACGGDYAQTVLACANYGRDSDSIATMAGSIAGALHGAAALPRDWVEVVQHKNRIDFAALSVQLLALFRVFEQRKHLQHSQRQALLAVWD